MDSLPPWSAVEELLRTLVLPAAGAAAGLLAMVCFLTKHAAARLAGGALAVAAGLVAGNESRGLLEWWPSDGMSWWSGQHGWPLLLPATVAAICGGLLATLASARTHWTAGLAIRLLTAAGCAWWLAEAFPPLSSHGTLALVFAGMVLNWEALLAAGDRSAGRGALPALVIPWGCAAATVLIFAHSARFFDLAVLLTAIFCGIGLVAVIWKLDLAALLASPAVFFPALMLAGAGNTYSEVPRLAFALVALAPCALWILLLPPFRRWPARAMAVAAVVTVLLPSAAGAIMAGRAETLEFEEE